MTGLLSSSSKRSVQRNAVILPAYSFALGLIALLGFMAVAAGVKAMPEFAAGFKAFGNNFAVPALFLKSFPAWFVGIAFAAIAIGALVPAAIMSIACANLFTRNIYKEFFHPAASPKQECDIAKIVSLVVKLGALFFIIGLPTQYAIQLQLLGGIWIIQTFAIRDPRPLHAQTSSDRTADRMGVRYRRGNLDGGAVGVQDIDLCAEHPGHNRALLRGAEFASPQHCYGGGVERAFQRALKNTAYR